MRNRLQSDLEYAERFRTEARSRRDQAAAAVDAAQAAYLKAMDELSDAIDLVFAARNAISDAARAEAESWAPVEVADGVTL